MPGFDSPGRREYPTTMARGLVVSLFAGCSNATLNKEKKTMADDTQSPDQLDGQETTPATGEQDTLGDAGKKALDAERTARKEQERINRELQSRIDEFEDAKRTDVEKATRKADKLAAELEAVNAKIATFERDALAREVAAEVGIPVDAVGRIQGATREEMVADAQELKGLLAPDGPRRPLPVPEAGRVSEPKRTAEQQFTDFFSQNFS